MRGRIQRISLAEALRRWGADPGEAQLAGRSAATRGRHSSSRVRTTPAGRCAATVDCHFCPCGQETTMYKRPHSAGGTLTRGGVLLIRRTCLTRWISRQPGARLVMWAANDITWGLVPARRLTI